MPIPSQGAVPSGAIYNELTALTRRAFMPRVTVQIYNATPTLMMLMGGAQRSAGGVNQITVPVQGASMVAGAWTSYSGTFNKPQIMPGVSNAQFSTSYFVVPVPLVMGEALLQSTEAVVPILDVRMNDVRAVSVQQMASALFTNNSANSLMPQGFVEAYDNGSNVVNYGGISRTAAGNSFWQGNYFASAGAVLTREDMARYLLRVTDLAGGESPDFVVMSPPDFAALVKEFVGVEQINIVPNSRDTRDMTIRSAFPNVSISGVPFFMDHWCPKGTAYFVNTKYTSMYLSEDAPFLFSGFYSAIPLLQIAQIGVMIVGYNVVTTKPSSGAVVTGITGGAW